MRFLPASIVVALACTAAGVLASPTVRIALAFEDDGAAIPAAIRTAATDEAARLWSEYGVVVSLAQTRSENDGLRTVAVVLAAAREGRAGDDLGSIRFSPDGIPDARIALYYDAIVRLATGSGVMGSDSRLGPAALRDLAIGRAMGRALAHEIGHFVLRSPHHAGSGLMRPVQHASALVDPSRKGFALTGVDRARLQIVLAAEPIAVASR